MSTAPDGREIVPAGEQEILSEHMYPIAKFLIEERGHWPIEKPEEYGFYEPWECRLTRAITQEDWDAINERFVIPPNIGFMFGYLIRDGANGIDIIGFDKEVTMDGVVPIDATEAEIRERDAHLHRPQPL